MPINEIQLQGFDEPILVTSVGQLDEAIEQYEEKKPKQRGTPEYRIWKKNMNRLIDTANRLAGIKRYKLKK